MGKLAEEKFSKTLSLFIPFDGAHERDAQGFYGDNGLTDMLALKAQHQEHVWSRMETSARHKPQHELVEVRRHIQAERRKMTDEIKGRIVSYLDGLFKNDPEEKLAFLNRVENAGMSCGYIDPDQRDALSRADHYIKRYTKEIADYLIESIMPPHHARA